MAFCWDGPKHPSCRTLKKTIIDVFTNQNGWKSDWSWECPCAIHTYVRSTCLISTKRLYMSIRTLSLEFGCHNGETCLKSPLKPAAFTGREPPRVLAKCTPIMKPRLLCWGIHRFALPCVGFIAESHCPINSLAAKKNKVDIARFHIVQCSSHFGITHTFHCRDTDVFPICVSKCGHRYYTCTQGVEMGWDVAWIQII